MLCVMQAGGYVRDRRVNGSLNLSHAIGDMEYKRTGHLSVACLISCVMQAGGYIMEGQVSNSLHLSRTLGDMKYKFISTMIRAALQHLRDSCCVSCTLEIT